MRKLFFRLYQKIMYALSFFISFKEPIIIKDQKGLEKVPYILKEKHKYKVFIVTDKFLVNTETFKQMVKAIESIEIGYQIYDETKPNPTIDLIEEAYGIYKENLCDSLIAYGGGSVIDLAKVVGARVVKPNQSIAKMKGTLKVLKKIPLLIAIPSTVGTGSEATLAAVVSNANTQEKYAIMDPVLMPDYAVLDLDVVKSLPKKLIAETGMDALTHAVEAYIGKANTKKTKRMAISAVKIVFESLKKAYDGDLDALHEMELAAYQAGVAFTRAYVGNVHAIAHQMSAYYHLGHGYANAVILPHVLKYYKNKTDKKLSKLMDVIEPGSNKSINEKANAFIDKIEILKSDINIDKTFNGLIKEEDVASIVNKAYKEANPLYPVPVILSRDDFKALIDKIN
ncbi:MAG: iron-containing alcohol dehydrogenase [Tenericutes bacterium]|jgi:alcohol dehydrogenase|nr:iron-containing alcohol dehydrogenase [Mycoplasmatota bacterium]